MATLNTGDRSLSPAAHRQAARVAAGARERWLTPAPMMVALLVLARLLTSPMALLNDPDTYLHIAVGRWIIAHGALPTHDPFSFSMHGALWLAPEWLAEVVFAAVYAHAGWTGVVVLSAACVALAVAIVAHFLLRRLGPLPTFVGALAAFSLLEAHSLARPHILALPLFVLWVGALLAARDDGRPPPFALLPVMALWANLHGSFLFGLALAGFLAGEAVLQPAAARGRWGEARVWGAFVAAAFAAALLTPHGIWNLIEPFRLMRMPALQTGFVEWMSPNFQQAPALEAALLGLLAIGFASGCRLPATRLVLLLGVVHMALQHSRHADVLAIVGPLAMAAPLARQLPMLARGQAPSALTARLAWLVEPHRNAALALAAAIAVMLALPALHPIRRSDDLVTPARALAAAQRLGLSGPVFNSEIFGDYLVFRGVPPLIDGRIELYGNAALARQEKAERGDEKALTGILASYDITWALVEPGTGASVVLDHLPGWKRVYADDRAVVYRRD